MDHAMWTDVATVLIAGTVGFGGAWIGAYVRLVKLNGALTTLAQALKHEAEMRKALEGRFGQCHADHRGGLNEIFTRLGKVESDVARFEGALSKEG